MRGEFGEQMRESAPQCKQIFLFFCRYNEVLLRQSPFVIFVNRTPLSVVVFV